MHTPPSCFVRAMHERRWFRKMCSTTHDTPLPDRCHVICYACTAGQKWAYFRYVVGLFWPNNGTCMVVHIETRRSLADLRQISGRSPADLSRSARARSSPLPRHDLSYKSSTSAKSTSCILFVRCFRKVLVRAKFIIFTAKPIISTAKSIIFNAKPIIINHLFIHRVPAPGAS